MNRRVMKFIIGFTPKQCVREREYEEDIKEVSTDVFNELDMTGFDVMDYYDSYPVFRNGRGYVVVITMLSELEVRGIVANNTDLTKYRFSFADIEEYREAI